MITAMTSRFLPLSALLLTAAACQMKGDSGTEAVGSEDSSDTDGSGDSESNDTADSQDDSGSEHVKCGPDERECGEQSQRDLLAGQRLDAGDVFLENDDTTLTVTIQTESNWLLEEVHLHVADRQGAIPTTLVGNPIPGQFDHQWEGLADTELVAEIPLADIPHDVSCGDDLVIALHAVVVRSVSGVEDRETAWGCGRKAPGRNWAMYIDTSVACCDSDPDPDPDPDPVCDKTSVKDVLDPTSGSFVGNEGPDQILELGSGTIQEAVDAAEDHNDDGYIIVMVRKDDSGEAGGTTTESLDVQARYDDPFALIGCSVTLEDPDLTDGLPTARVSASADSPGDPAIFVMDVHASGSDGDGWVIEGEHRTLRNSRALDNGAAGIRVVGDHNLIHNSPEISGNAEGVVLEGSDNTLSDCEVVANAGVGVTVSGDRNQLHGNDIGTPNRGNGDDGLQISGDGDGDGGVVELSENVVEENQGVGIAITGSGHQLEGNQSGDREDGTGDNVGCEYEVAAGNHDAGDNEANGESVGTGSGDFPSGCQGSP